MTPQRRYSLVGHRQVEGWIEPPILAVIDALTKAQTRLDVRGGIAEIGVHDGRFFLALYFALRPDERAVAIEFFDLQEFNVDGSGIGDRTAFERNLARHVCAAGNVEIVTADSTKMSGEDVRRHAGGPIRLFSVDGGHTAATVDHDMQTAADSLAAGGIEIGDDVFNYVWPETAEGTFRFLDRDGRLVLFGIGFNKTMITAPEHAEQYRAALRKLASRHA